MGRKNPITQRTPEHSFRHNKNSKKTARILASPNTGVCPRCFAIIEWRKKYRCYKPLNAPKKCTTCEQKTVVAAYHIICPGCTSEQKCCAKCRLPRSEWPTNAVAVDSITKADI